jgi:uncharacterized membrane protein
VGRIILLAEKVGRRYPGAGCQNSNNPSGDNQERRLMHCTSCTPENSTLTICIPKVVEMLKAAGVCRTSICYLQILFNAVILHLRDEFLDKFKYVYVPGTHLCRFVSNGFYKTCLVIVKIGFAIYLNVPKIIDRCKEVDKEQFKIFFLEDSLRMSNVVNEFALYLYKKGIPLNNIQDVIDEVFGVHIEGFSSAHMTYKKGSLELNYNQFLKRDLSPFNECHIMIDGTYLNIKDLKEACLLSAVAVTPEGYSVIGWMLVKSESEADCGKLCRQLKSQGLKNPKMVVCDGSKGIIKAISMHFKGVKVQRCIIHKARNIASNLPYDQRKVACELFMDIFNVETIEEARNKFLLYKEIYKNNKKVTNCLKKGEDELFTYFQFNDIDHSRIRTTNPIESLFSVVKPCIKGAKGNFSIKTVEYTTFSFISHLVERFGPQNDEIITI